MPRGKDVARCPKLRCYRMSMMLPTRVDIMFVVVRDELNWTNQAIVLLWQFFMRTCHSRLFPTPSPKVYLNIYNSRALCGDFSESAELVSCSATPRSFSDLDRTTHTATTVFKQLLAFHRPCCKLKTSLAKMGSLYIQPLSNLACNVFCFDTIHFSVFQYQNKAEIWNTIAVVSYCVPAHRCVCVCMFMCVSTSSASCGVCEKVCYYSFSVLDGQFKERQ